MKRLDFHLHIPPTTQPNLEVHVHIHEQRGPKRRPDAKDAPYQQVSHKPILSSFPYLSAKTSDPYAGARRSHSLAGKAVLSPQLLALQMAETQSAEAGEVVMAEAMTRVAAGPVILERLEPTSPYLKMWESVGPGDAIGEWSLQIIEESLGLCGLLTLQERGFIWLCRDWTPSEPSEFEPVSPKNVTSRLPLLLTAPTIHNQ